MEFSIVIAKLCNTGGATATSVYHLVGCSDGFVYEEAEDLAFGDLDLDRGDLCNSVMEVVAVGCLGEFWPSDVEDSSEDMVRCKAEVVVLGSTVFAIVLSSGPMGLDAVTKWVFSKESWVPIYS